MDDSLLQREKKGGYFVALHQANVALHYVAMKAMPSTSRVSITTKDKTMHPIAHPGRLLKRELEARSLSANRLALALGVPSGRITDILNGRRSITAETAIRLGRYFGNRPCFWLELQSRYDVIRDNP